MVNRTEGRCGEGRKDVNVFSAGPLGQQIDRIPYNCLENQFKRSGVDKFQEGYPTRFPGQSDYLLSQS